jgi:N-sulfoglucosamine sulfohydrolase
MASPADTGRRPNIVLIVSDDHGREALGCYGNPVVSTPVLDQLAAEGTRFTNSFCTTASCAASRSVILTGLYNHTNGTFGHTHGVHHFSCYDDVVTLPAMLNAGGYRTGRAGKKHYAPESLFPFQWHCPEGYGRDDVGMAEACREFVAERAPGAVAAPFFLYWCSHDPHRARVVEDHPLRPNNFGNPVEPFPGDTEHRFSEDEVIVPSFLSDTPEVRAEIAQYYQSIARLDRGIGRLIEILKETGRDENTVILYISDNGAAFPEAKTTLYEPGMNLPLIVRDPRQATQQGCAGMTAGMAAGIATDALVTWADITPTVLDFAGLYADAVEHGATFHGKSFKDVLDQESPSDWRDEVYAAHTFHEITNYYPMRVLRTKRYKFIWNIAWKLDYSFASDLWVSACWQAVVREGMTHFGARSVDAYLHRPRFELYDVIEDPDEVVNLADRPEYAALVEEFCAKLRRFQQQTRDPWEHKWIYE